jgi:hypothetical protein
MTERVTPSGYVLTPEQQLKQEERKRAKLAKKAANGALRPIEEPPRATILKRKWLDVVGVGSPEPNSSTLSIATWNVSARLLEDISRLAHRLSEQILAQTLVRRELFPGSGQLPSDTFGLSLCSSTTTDCLRWKDRENGLVQEFKTYPADVMCLQVSCFKHVITRPY